MDIQPSQPQNDYPLSESREAGRVEGQPPQRSNKKLIIISVIILLLLAIGAGAYWYFNNQQKPIGCTMEAKICPDGSYVSRTGPNCEFAACPATTDPTASWQTYRNEEYGFEVKYPNNWPSGDYADMHIFVIDPIKVIPSDILKTIDVSPGLISFWIELPGESSNVLIERYNNLPWKEVTIGENIKAKINETITTNDQPNPTYNNRHLITYETIKDKKSIRIQYNSDLQDKYLQIFNQILSTFKFTP